MCWHDERVILHRHPHWKRLIGPVLALLVGDRARVVRGAVVNSTDWDPQTRRIVWP